MRISHLTKTVTKCVDAFSYSVAVTESASYSALNAAVLTFDI